MPGYASDTRDPRRELEKRSQEYERTIEEVNEKLVHARKGKALGLSAAREAHALVAAIVRDEEKDPETWRAENLKRAHHLSNFLSATIQDMERPQ
jgi:hypothetical protein